MSYGLTLHGWHAFTTTGARMKQKSCFKFLLWLGFEPRTSQSKGRERYHSTTAHPQCCSLWCLILLVLFIVDSNFISGTLFLIVTFVDLFWNLLVVTEWWCLFSEREQNRDQMTADVSRSSGVSMEIRMEREAASSFQEDSSPCNNIDPRMCSQTLCSPHSLSVSIACSL